MTEKRFLEDVWEAECRQFSSGRHEETHDSNERGNALYCTYCTCSSTIRKSHSKLSLCFHIVLNCRFIFCFLGASLYGRICHSGRSGLLSINSAQVVNRIENKIESMSTNENKHWCFSLNNLLSFEFWFCCLPYPSHFFLSLLDLDFIFKNN